MSDTFSECASTRPAVPAHAGEDTLGRPRVAVVLAAGRSERLADVTGGGSKALIRVGGLSLVDRAVRNLLAARIERVLRHRGLPGRRRSDRRKPDRARPRARAVFAENWERGNGASLASVEPHVAEEGSFLLVTTDHVFCEGSLEPLLSASGPV
jgi:choline kinase